MSKRKQTKYKDIEILEGQWAYSDRNAIVFGNTIPELDASKWFVEEKKPERELTHVCDQTGTGRELKPSNIDELMMMADWIELELHYDDWTKIIWSLASEGQYDVAMKYSQRNKKHEDEYFDRIYNQYKSKGLTIKTFYYYARKGNPEEYAKYFVNKLKIDDLDDDVYADMILEELGDKIIYKNNKVYLFNGKRWEDDPKLERLKAETRLILEPYLKSLYIAESHNRDKETHEKKRQYLKREAKSVAGNTRKSSIVQNAKSSLLLRKEQFNEIEFDNNPMILPFKSNVLDLKTLKFRDYKPEDYITKYITYDVKLRGQCIGSMNKLKSVFEKIQRDEDMRNDLYMYLATGLYGTHIENLIINNGCGRNGKGFIGDLMLRVLQFFAKRVSGSLLKGNEKVDAIDPVKASCDGLRLIFVDEPDSGEIPSISGAKVKSITGAQNGSVRRMYDSNTDFKWCATLFADFNEKPMITGRIDNSIACRLIDFGFDSTFSPGTTEDDYQKRTFIPDDEVKSDDFLEEHKHAMQ